MVSLTRTVTMVIAVALLAVGCGRNPFGSGSTGGLSLFAKVGKAIAKPSAINEEENSEENAQKTVATKAAKRFLAKGFATSADSSGIKDTTINGSSAFYYWEILNRKPDDGDSEKLSTGKATIVFKYTGDPLTNFDESKITDFVSWSFIGRNEKTWNNEIDSVQITVNFSSTDINNIKPGFTTAWGKNISSTIELGRDDTAYFAIDSLDPAKQIQYGAGSFYNANSGDNNDEGSKSFNFDIQILHINRTGINPYLKYEDNEGILSFIVPWGTSGDSLYFNVHFYPQNGSITAHRIGEIRKNSSTGAVLVTFEYNKYGIGKATYYNEDGEEIGTENS